MLLHEIGLVGGLFVVVSSYVTTKFHTPVFNIVSHRVRRRLRDVKAVMFTIHPACSTGYSSRNANNQP